MEPNDAASSSSRAQEMRASLGTRREVEALLAEASATREAAVADADAIIEEAQQVSDQLLRESRSEGERTTTDARLRAEGVVGRARTEAEDITRQARAAADAVRARAEAQVEEHRRRVRAELTEQVTREVTEQSRRELARVHERQQATIGDLEASVRILGVSMEAAVANISEMLGALDSLRAHTAESLGEATIPSTAPPRHAESAGEAEDDDVDSEDDDAVGDDDDEANQGSGRSVRAGHLIDALADLDTDGATGTQPAERDDEKPPLTATEAFLRSAHVDHGDPPLPPTEDSDVSARYAHDAMRANARARSRRADDQADPDERAATDDGDGEGDEAEASGKPLGWLFRSS
jgi:F0F1-type ATP synthase membrane subunit b/b'